MRRAWPNAVYAVSYATTRKKQRKIYIPAISTPVVVFHSRREIVERDRSTILVHARVHAYNTSEYYYTSKGSEKFSRTEVEIVLPRSSLMNNDQFRSLAYIYIYIYTLLLFASVTVQVQVYFRGYICVTVERSGRGESASNLVSARSTKLKLGSIDGQPRPECPRFTVSFPSLPPLSRRESSAANFEGESYPLGQYISLQ